MLRLLSIAGVPVRRDDDQPPWTLVGQQAGRHRRPEATMTSQAAGPAPRAWRQALAAPAGSAAAPGATRRLQLGLAALWLLDAVLQFQGVMFTRSFARTLGVTAHGNPAVIAAPITWSAGLIGQHAVAANAAFAVIQLLIGLGIAWRPTVKVALSASIAWSLAVWWLGEGLGGLLNGTASPVNGAPGAVILYALLAVLLWPPRQDQRAAFAAGGRIGVQPARLLWLVLWGGLAGLALAPATAAPRALSSMIAGMASAEPAWLAGIDGQIASRLSHHGPAAAIALAVLLVVIAVGIYLPERLVRSVLALAILTAAALWLAEAFGGLLGGGGTDPNTGPLLGLLTLAYWPVRQQDHDGPAGETTAPAARSMAVSQP
jgi:hypothetical protein